MHSTLSIEAIGQEAALPVLVVAVGRVPGTVLRGLYSAVPGLEKRKCPVLQVQVANTCMSIDISHQRTKVRPDQTQNLVKPQQP